MDEKDSGLIVYRDKTDSYWFQVLRLQGWHWMPSFDVEQDCYSDKLLPTACLYNYYGFAWGKWLVELLVYKAVE